MDDLTIMKDVEKYMVLYMEKAYAIWGKEKLENLIEEVRYDLRGTTAGSVCYEKKRVRFNKYIIKANYNRFLHRTVPHELAHLISYRIYGQTGHDVFWYRVMEALEVKDYSPRHDYDTSLVPKRRRY